MNKNLRIIYMGTPGFAVPPLKLLVENGWNIVGVITAVDKPAGRRLQLRQSAVKEYALTAGLKVLQPPNLKAEDFQEELRGLNADLQVVVAFRMLPESVWDMPKLGTFNLHASKLPDYRGAAPINWAIINGETATGLTTFFIKHAIDTGSIIFQEDTAINNDDTAGTLHDRMSLQGARLVLKTVEAIAEGNTQTYPQDLTGDFPEAPKIFRTHCEIEWNKTAREIHNKIRGLSPYPGAWTTLNGKTLKIYRGEICKEDPSEKDTPQDPGTFLFQPGKLFFRTADSWYALLEVQLEGKKRMTAEELLRGYRH